jgi:hypothetical protein
MLLDWQSNLIRWIGRVSTKLHWMNLVNLHVLVCRRIGAADFSINPIRCISSRLIFFSLQ